MRKETVAKLSMLCLMMVMLFPTYVFANDNTGEEYSTPLTVTVPEQPAGEIITYTEEGGTLKSVELPEGWKWKEPDTRLIPGDYLEAIAVYEDGGIVTEKKVRVGQRAKIIKDWTDAAYVVGKDTKFTITCTGELFVLQKVEMDGIVVPSTEYIVKSGSTILVFQKSYMDALTEGSHTITLKYPTGNVSTTVQISKEQETITTSTGTDNNASDINTSDNTSTTVWIVLMLLGSSVIGGSYIRRKKVANKNEK